MRVQMRLLAVAAAFAINTGPVQAQNVLLPTGQYLTPTAAPGSQFMRLRTPLRADGSADADGAVASAISPDGTAMLVLTTGYDSTYFTEAGKPIVHAVLDPLTGLASKTTTPA